MAVKKRFESVRPDTKTIEAISPRINVGAGVDLLTGSWVTLPDGSSIINGGLSQYWAISGPANSYKTGIMLYFEITAADRVAHVTTPSMFTYDTENTYDIPHLTDFMSKTKYLKSMDVLNSGAWNIVNKSMMLAGEYWEIFKKWIVDITKNKRSMTVTTPFYDSKTKSQHKMTFPSFSSVDSFSEVESETANAKEGKVKMGDDKGRMYFMNMGFDKARILTGLGSITLRSGTYTLLSSHFGNENSMQGGTGIPQKKMTDMPPGKVIKGVPDKFSYLLVHIWLTRTAVVLRDRSGSAVEYPRAQAFKNEPPGDLQRVNATLVRSKTSPGGGKIDFIVSQKFGVQPSLTELKHLRDNGYYGITGSTSRYAFDLYPDTVLMRTTAREIMDGDAKLRRAINISMEMYQTFSRFLYDDPKLVCTPAELRADLEAKDYDWDKILSSRGWWTVEDDSHPIPRLSTMDLLNIRIGKFTAKWAMKTVTKEKPNAKKKATGERTRKTAK